MNWHICSCFFYAHSLTRLQIKAKVEPFVSRLPPAFFEQRSLLPATLATPSILSALGEINSILRDDYTTRRGMLLQRLDVTVESFLWSAKALGKCVGVGERGCCEGVSNFPISGRARF